MKFIDEAVIKITAGKGGDGIISFRREKYIPRGGPDGGNGGKGGDVVLIADNSLNTLSNFRYKTIFKAKNGRAGEGKNKSGLSGEDLIILTPLGTKVYDLETGYLIGELLSHEERLIVGNGGEPGVGNTMFKSSINQTPRQFSKGTIGDYLELKLELSVLADIGLLGLPNAGKSSLLRKISMAQPKVADYPFTTLQPNLGVVNPYPGVSFVVADIPGIIEGAFDGAGLGLQFLKHVNRTKMLLHVVDCLPIDGSKPLDNIKKVNNEVVKYGNLGEKEQWVIINKIDLINKDELKVLKAKIKKHTKKIKILAISSLDGQGIELMLKELSGMFVVTDEW